MYIVAYTRSLFGYLINIFIAVIDKKHAGEIPLNKCTFIYQFILNNIAKKLPLVYFLDLF